MKSFLRSFTTFRRIKKGHRQLLATVCVQALVNHLEDYACLGKVSSFTDRLAMTLIVFTGH